MAIDFNGRFTRDYLKWCQKHPDLSKDEDKLEELLPRLYDKWFSSPKKWLDGISPNEYFERIDDAQIYASLLVQYVEEEITLPDPLTAQLHTHADEVYPILRNMLFVDDGSLAPDALVELRAAIVSLITEMRREHVYARYVELLAAATESDALTEELCLALSQAEDPAAVRALLLEAYPAAEEYGRACLLQLLCEQPDEDGQVFALVRAAWLAEDMPIPMLAECFELLGDERALPLLRETFARPDNNYETYTALRFAIEAMTGEELPEKDFTGDPDYDRVAAWEDKDA